MSVLKSDEAPKIEPLSDQDQGQACKVYAGGRALLVRSADKEAGAAAHFYATTAARHVPDFRPEVLGHDAARGILVEELFDADECKSMAQDLLEGGAGYSTPFDEGHRVDLELVLYWVGLKIGKIHAGTRGFVQAGDAAKAPATQAGPPDTYLAAARAHPHLAHRLRGIAETSARVEPVLLHGCLSPGSVLFGKDARFNALAIAGPDRIASGDPALDLAHMMAHLFVASVHQMNSILVTSAGAFQSGYANEVPDKLSIMFRAGPLTVAYMLALLEDAQTSSFLNAKDRDIILDFSQWWLGRRDYTLGQVRSALWDAVDAGGINWREEFESLPRADE